MNEYENFIDKYDPKNNKGSGESEGIIYKEAYKSYGEGYFILATDNGIDKMILCPDNFNGLTEFTITSDNSEYNFTIKRYINDQKTEYETVTFDNNNSRKIKFSETTNIYIKDNYLYMIEDSDIANGKILEPETAGYIIPNFDFTVLPDDTK